jgi:hypothetical protein
LLELLSGSGIIVEGLAKTRHALAVHLVLAWNTISSVQADHQLGQFDYPNVPVAAVTKQTSPANLWRDVEVLR